MSKTTFINGSEISSIEFSDINNRGRRSELMSFYCDGCDCVHIDYPIKDVHYAKSDEYIMCKESAEKLDKHKENR